MTLEIALLLIMGTAGIVHGILKKSWVLFIAGGALCFLSGWLNSIGGTP